MYSVSKQTFLNFLLVKKKLLNNFMKNNKSLRPVSQHFQVLPFSFHLRIESLWIHSYSKQLFLRINSNNNNKCNHFYSACIMVGAVSGMLWIADFLFTVLKQPHWSSNCIELAFMLLLVVMVDLHRFMLTCIGYVLFQRCSGN